MAQMFACMGSNVLGVHPWFDAVLEWWVTCRSQPCHVLSWRFKPQFPPLTWALIIDTRALIAGTERVLARTRHAHSSTASALCSPSTPSTPSTLTHPQLQLHSPPVTAPVMTPADAASEISYIDYETFLSPAFSPHAFASTLITSTNDPSDPTVDLTTPLSRVLFDLQEIDTHIHTLTTTSALPLLTYTARSHAASTTLLAAIATQTAALTAAHTRLTHSVASRAAPAAQLTTAATNLHAATSLLRELGRALALARQLEIQLAESPTPMLRAAHSVAELRRLLAANTAAMDGIDLATSLTRLVVAPAEAALIARSRDTLAAFSQSQVPAAAGAPPASAAFALDPAVVAEGQRPAVAAALQTLRLLAGPDGLAATVQELVDGQVAAAVGVLTRALAALTLLERGLGEVAARCRVLVGVEGVLAGAGLAGAVLEALDTGALGTLFFGRVAAGWEVRVREVVARGGANARILRTGREKLREGVRGCVLRGLGDEGRGEFEVAVMVGAVASLGSLASTRRPVFSLQAMMTQREG
ncbi:Golgi transport complex subunit 5-domain-containing protein [Morchella snyderi]|nr:Golgi transport complex subunit 5-domain-containing protein [Morchella snyderi]